MGMVVRTNTMANNAFRQLGMNNSAVAKSLEKLSSGFRINRAGDDASGLAISEKMKAQIKGLEQASTNSQDGISLIQTAEGALTEVHNMLNRMVELATKSANGTIQNEVDRENIQNEVNALTDEINRIGNATNFNGINLLDGSLSTSGGSAAAGVPTVKGLTMTDVVGVAGVYTTAITGITSELAKGSELTYKFADSTGKNTEIKLTVGDAGKLIGADGTEYTATVGTTDSKKTTATNAQLVTALVGELGKTSLADKFTIATDTGNVKFTAKETGTGAASMLVVNGPGATGTGAANTAATIATTAADAYQKGAVVADKEFSVGGQKFMIATTADKAAAAGKNVNVVVATAVDGTSLANLAGIIEQKTGYKPAVDGTTGFSFTANTASTAASGGLKLQIGDTSADFNKLIVSVGDMRADALGVGAVDVSTQDAAGAQIDVVKTAINTVSKTRGDLGALQNRLEYTINNLDTTAENMTSANSRIRDTDMAKEMMQYTKMNVLVQSAQAMLAQANQQPQSILQLLQ